MRTGHLTVRITEHTHTYIFIYIHIRIYATYYNNVIIVMKCLKKSMLVLELDKDSVLF